MATLVSKPELRYTNDIACVRPADAASTGADSSIGLKENITQRQISQLSEELGCESDAWLRRALHTDDLRAASVLKDLVCSASAKSEIQNTRGATAEGMLEFIDMVSGASRTLGFH